MELRRTSSVVAPANSKTRYGSSDAESAAKKEFDILRPVTIQVMSSPTINNLSQLINIVEHLPEKVEPCILDYIMYPLSHQLKLSRKLKEDVLVTLHDCLRIVLNKWQIDSFTYFAELYQFCVMAICKVADNTVFDASQSENLIEHILNTVDTLMERSLVKHFKKLYSPRYIPAVGHGIYVLIQIVEHDVPKSLKLLAIRIVMRLVQVCEGEEEVCHRLFSFLPGMASKFVGGSMIRGGRYQVDVIKESLEALKVSLNVCISFEKPENLKGIDTNLAPGLREISEYLIFHNEKRLRSALADFSISVLQDSMTKLPKCAEVLWNNVLIFASNDQDEEACKKSIRLVINPNNRKWVEEMCSFKTMEHHLKKAVIQSNVRELNKCNLSAHRVASSLIITKLSLAQLRSLLSRIADLRTTTIRRKAEVENGAASEEDRRIENCCLRMCQNILEEHELDVVIAEFMGLLDRCNNLDDVTYLRSAGAIQLMNEVLKLFVVKKPTELDYHLVETITEKYIALLSPLPIMAERLPDGSPNSSKGLLTSDKKNGSETFNPLTGICVHSCCILEAFPTFAKLEPLILQLVTFPLLEYAGLREPEYLQVADTAVESLTEIAKISNLTLQEFLAINLDLVMSEFGTRTEVIADFPHMADALIFLAKYFDFSQSHFLTFIEQIIQFSTTHKLDTSFHEMFTNIYYAYVISMWKHYYEDAKKEDSEYSCGHYSSKKCQQPSLVDRLHDYQKALGIAPQCSEDSDEEGEQPSVDTHQNEMKDVKLKEEDGDCNNPENGDEDAQNESRVLRPEISLTLKIAKKAAAYLTDKTRIIKLNAMEILIKSIQLLSPYEDELLPLLHQCWVTLASRFEEKEYVVLRKSFQLLLTMVNYSGDFLRKRTIEGIFPILSNFLKDLARQSENIDSGNTLYFTYTQGFKLQHTILTGLAELCQAMEIGESDLNQVANACLIYLVPSQHKKLKESAIELLCSLGHGHCGSSIWMKLLAYGIVQPPPVPTHPNFKPIPTSFLDRSKDTPSKLKKKFVKPSMVRAIYPQGKLKGKNSLKRDFSRKLKRGPYVLKKLQE